MSRKCIGCGAILQSDDNKEAGYVPKEKLNDAKYCERCFKINNYNYKTVTELENINDKLIEEINKKAKYVYFMLDFLNINEETINTYKAIKVPKCLIISKLDIIPKSIKCNSISEWLHEVYNVTDRIIYQSSNKNIHTSEIINNILNSHNKVAYIVGYTNSGKSTLINTLLEGKDKLTTSNNLNTTMDFIEIDLDDFKLIDTPGFTYDKTFYQKDEFDLIKRSNPKQFLKPITYQTKDITRIIVEDRFSLNTSNVNSLTFYLSNDIKLNKEFNKDIEYPEIEYQINANSDIVIKSLGFINIKKPCTLKIRTKEKDLIEIRKSIFK